MTDLLCAEKDLPASLAEQMQIIHDSGRALLAIVNSILDISQLSAQRAQAYITVQPRNSKGRAGTGGTGANTRSPPPSRPTRNFAPIRQAVNIRTVVANTINTFGALATTKGINYIVRIDPALPSTIFADETRLQQILGNLIGMRLSLLQRRRTRFW